MAVAKTKATELVFVEAEIQYPNARPTEYHLLMAPSVQVASALVRYYITQGTRFVWKKIDLPWYEVFQRAAEIQHSQYKSGIVDFADGINDYFNNLYKADKTPVLTEEDRIPNAVVLVQSKAKIF